MSKEVKFKDVAHLYLGCDIKCVDAGSSSDNEYFGRVSKLSALLLDKYTNGKWKPLLIPLDKMSEEDAIELCEYYGGYGDLPGKRTYETWLNSFGNIIVSWGKGLREKWSPSDCNVWKPEQILIFLSKGYDIFNLIPSGEAIDKTIFKPC